MAKHIRALTVKFDLPISYREIPLFRGAVLKSMGDRANVLYHNHTGEETFRYSYPLIQYKRLGGKAAIICVEEGMELVGEILSNVSGNLRIGENAAECLIEQVETKEVLVQTSEQLSTYHLHRWLPLNSKNYNDYQNAESYVEKIQILEHVLTGNILSFLKGIGIRLDEQMVVNITDIKKQQLISYKRIKLLALDVEFRTNIHLPSLIGLGKNASLGFGTITKIKN